MPRKKPPPDDNPPETDLGSLQVGTTFRLDGQPYQVKQQHVPQEDACTATRLETIEVNQGHGVTVPQTIGVQTVTLPGDTKVTLEPTTE